MSKIMLSKLEKKIIKEIQSDIPIVERPYYELSKKLNITEQCFIETLTNLTDKGIIRRFGATLRHQKSGYGANAMTAWKVNINQVETTGTIMASFREVSHCYHRKATKEWPYNIYAMVHGTNKEECCNTIKTISKKTDINIYSILFSIKELKKTSMIYFNDKHNISL